MLLNDLNVREDFYFTQGSLSAFDQCPLKFKRRYLDGYKWDKILDTDMKNRLQLGRDFHLLAQRYFMGIDTGIESGHEEERNLMDWIGNLKECFRISEDYTYLPEHKIRISKESLKLEANFDLLIVKEDCIEIWDWKTQSNNTRLISKLKNSMQTMVYLFVLAEQGYKLIGSNLKHEKISMCYWEPERKNILAQINYSQELHESFGEILKSRADIIRNYDYTCFDREEYKTKCKRCEFNHVCKIEDIT